MFALQTAMRAAAVELLEDYVADAGLALNVYPGRPRTISPPHAFVDRIRERMVHHADWQERLPVVDVVVVHAVFDSKDATEQRDAFVDGFVEWASENPHKAGPNTVLGIVAVDDDPNWVADWMPPDRQFQYYATTFSLEGYGGA